MKKLVVISVALFAAQVASAQATTEKVSTGEKTVNKEQVEPVKNNSVTVVKVKSTSTPKKLAKRNIPARTEEKEKAVKVEETK